MRNLVLGFHRPSGDEFTKLWKDGTLIFDTSVLLNIYSYPESVRDVFLSVLKKVGKRAWIPYHVALEFERNRISRIRQANDRVERLVSVIQKNQMDLKTELEAIELDKRNLEIKNLPARIDALKDAHEKVSEAVKAAVDRLPAIGLEDPIRDQLAEILDGQVGPFPKSQDEADALAKDGADRFAKKIPPGFLDADKGEVTVRDRGLVYERRFGDLIAWRQILDHVKAKKIRQVLLITGDRKEDWWWREGGKTLGPLPDLVQEIRLVGDASSFWMYTADQFLQNAEKYLEAREVTPEAVDRVKEAAASNMAWSSTTSLPFSSTVSTTSIPFTTTIFDGALGNAGDGTSTVFSVPMLQTPTARDRITPVARWLASQFPDSVVHPSREFPDLVVSRGSEQHGYEIKYLTNFRNFLFPPGPINALLRGYFEVREGRLSTFSLVLIMSDDDFEHLLKGSGWQAEAQRRIRAITEKYVCRAIILGALVGDTFNPLVIVQGKG